MQAKGQLNEAAVYEFAQRGRHADIVAALSLLCGSPLQLVEGLLQNMQHVACLVPCKAIGLDWQTVRAILTCRSVRRTMENQDLDAARTDYSKLSQAVRSGFFDFGRSGIPLRNNAAEPATSAPTVPGEPKFANFIQPMRIAANVGDKPPSL